MRTQTKYEEIILEEIRSLPPPVLPKAIKMLRSLREGVNIVTGRVGRKTATDTERTGFCGVWKDDRRQMRSLRILPLTVAVMAEERSICEVPLGHQHLCPKTLP